MLIDFESAWLQLHPAFRRGLELAYESLLGGGLAVGATLTDQDGRLVAEGRNRAYDPPGGPDALQGTPLAHAEMNAMAAARTGWSMPDCTLWSTQQPCAMCAAAATFIDVGQIRYLAPDPWAIATGQPSSGYADGPLDGPWLVTANVLFLGSIVRRAGPDHPTVVRNAELEPAIAALAVELVSHPLPDAGLAALLPQWWDRIVAAAAG